MEYIYQDLNIFYEQLGEGLPIILLHGWGTNHHTFNALSKMLKNKYQVFVLDLPGFGNSSEPAQPFSVGDYVTVLKAFINDLGIKNPIILGHSFGGRIAIKYAGEKNPLSKLILVDSAGIKPRQTICKKIKIMRYKFLKYFYKKTKNINKYNQLVKVSGSSDYKAATPIMKGTLSLVVREDLKKYLTKIDCETLIIWGKDDHETPYKDGIKMNKLIKNSGLVTFDNTGHFPYLEKKQSFLLVIGKYLEV